MRRVLVVTSGRADASPLHHVIGQLRVHCKVNRLELIGVTPSEATSQAHVRIETYRPDIVVLLGDRFETLAAASAATFCRVPIAHIHGGESTHGAMDDQIRHAVTKMSHLHFAAAGEYAERIKSMGENPLHVWVTGAPGLDNLAIMPRRRRNGKTIVMTYHPETLGSDEGAKEMMAALDHFNMYTVLWTGINNDPGSEKLDLLFRKKYGMQFYRLDQYIDACRGAAVMIGNSSSGVIEAPTMELPSVNIGTRQDGRLRAPSVFDAPPDKHKIVEAIKKAIAYTGPFTNPLGGPGASEVIAKIIATQNLKGILVKPWFSLSPK